MGLQSVELEDDIKMEPKEWDGRVWNWRIILEWSLKNGMAECGIGG